MVLDFRKSAAFWKISRLRTFVLQVWRIGGMIQTGKIRNTLRKCCPSFTLSSTNLTWTDPG